jgi:hypothetical protein
VLQARGAEPLRAGAGEAQGGAFEGDLGMVGDEVVEGPEPQPLRAQPAAGTGCMVRLAALLGAVGEDGLDGGAVEPRHIELGEADGNGPLVAGVYDRCHRQRAGDQRLSVLGGNQSGFHSMETPARKTQLGSAAAQ